MNLTTVTDMNDIIQQMIKNSDELKALLAFAESCGDETPRSIFYLIDERIGKLAECSRSALGLMGETQMPPVSENPTQTEAPETDKQAVASPVPPAEIVFDKSGTTAETPEENIVENTATQHPRIIYMDDDTPDDNCTEAESYISVSDPLAENAVWDNPPETPQPENTEEIQVEAEPTHDETPLSEEQQPEPTFDVEPEAEPTYDETPLSEEQQPEPTFDVEPEAEPTHDETPLSEEQQLEPTFDVEPEAEPTHNEIPLSEEPDAEIKANDEQTPEEDNPDDNMDDLYDTTSEEIKAEKHKPTVDEIALRSRAKDLRRAFSINDMFRFRRELFGNSAIQMTDAINLVDAMSSYAEAEDYFYNDLGWDTESDEVKDFMRIIHSHFS